MQQSRASTDDQHALKDVVRLGAVWGVIGALVMAMYAMVAAGTYQGTGFFTPTYHIASAVIEPGPMEQSMQHAMRNDNFFFDFGPAMTGMMVHLAVGIGYGIIFALGAHALRLRGAVSLLAGMTYGVVVMLFSAFVGLPLAASIFGGGDPISTMPAMVGWTTFTIEHLMFGGVLGIGHWLAHREGVEGRVPQVA
ncbi:MAG: hypothetical protein ACR2KQ_03810 [Actinomycetota bacterium]